MKNSKLTHAARVTENSKRMRLTPACVIANADVGTLARDQEDGAGEAYCSRSLDWLCDEVVENSSMSNRNVRASQLQDHLVFSLRGARRQRQPSLHRSGKRLGKAMRLQSSEMLNYFMNMVSKYSHLRSNCVKASANNKLTNYAIASRSTIIDDEHVGPHDAIRLIMSEDGKYKFMVYEHLLKDGTMQMSLTNSELQAVLEEMNDSCWSVCCGIADYSQYRSSIGYDKKSQACLLAA